MRIQGSGRRRTATVALAALAVVGVAGCSGGDDAGDTAVDAADADDGGMAEEAATAAETEAASGDRDGGIGDVGDDAAGTPQVVVGGDTAGRDVIREAHLVLASDEPAATVDAIGRAAERAGGFVSDTDLHRRDGVLAGTVTVRVPATELAGTLGRIEEAGAELRSRELSSRDVTTEVSDVAAQLRNLRALEAELVELLGEARAETGTDGVLTVFDRVRSVRDEIERLEGRRTTLADLVALATITVRVEPTEALLAATAQERGPEPAPWQPGQRVQAAWTTTVAALQATVDVAAVLVLTVLPLLLLWSLPVYGAIRLARWWRTTRPVPTTAGSVPSTDGRTGT